MNWLVSVLICQKSGSKIMSLSQIPISILNCYKIAQSDMKSHPMEIIMRKFKFQMKCLPIHPHLTTRARLCAKSAVTRMFRFDSNVISSKDKNRR